MDLEIYSHKNALEIIEHPNFKQAYDEITSNLRNLPLIYFKNKAIKNGKGNQNLDVSQPIMNKYLLYQFKSLGWEIQPYVIEKAELKADFRKTVNSRVFQIEIQFGNMSRWYSDVFKFQMASIVGKTDIGISIVPMKCLSDRIDSNIVNYERCRKELPEIQSLLHLPILLIGISPNSRTRQINLESFGFDILKSAAERKDIYAELKKGEYLDLIVQGIISNTDLSKINEQTALQPDVAEIKESEDDVPSED